MLSKIAALAHSKVALAALGVMLVGGGGSAVAVAATSSHLSTLGVNLSEAHSSTETPDSHAHTMGIEGLLTACSTTSTPATISVKDSAGKRWTLVVSATTKFNGDTQTASSAGQGASSAKGDNSTSGAGASSAKGDNSTHAGDNSAQNTTGAGASSAKGDNSAHATPTLADVCATANIGTRNVQVQATQNGSSYDAWKVTLKGSGSANSEGSGSNSASSNASGD
jgi:hypothetical protein